MAIEIERKFLVTDDSWRQSVKRHHYLKQGYLTDMSGNASVRVRLTDDKADINIKSMTLGVQRQEYEYAIPVDEARQLLDGLCRGPVIEKTRYLVDVGQHTWEIDVFEGDNLGLIVAEVELGAEDEAFELPTWAGKEVSDDTRYYNVSLLANPYKLWQDA